MVRSSAPAFAAGAVALWSTNALVARYLLADHPLALVQFLQFTGAALVFLLIRLLSRTVARPTGGRRAAPHAHRRSSAWSERWCCNIWPLP